MDTKALHKQKLQAQLDEWKADIAKLKLKQPVILRMLKLQ
jgi:hypothetical protein